MKAFQITSMKNFMKALLATDAFDSFLLEEAVIGMGCTFHIDGHVNRDFYKEETENADSNNYEFRPWSEMRSVAFDLIKGKKTPLFFRFVLHLKPEQTASMLAKANCDVDASLVKALALNIRYDGGKAVITTGTAFTTFVLSKEPDTIWDAAVTKFLTAKEIDFEEI